ncbi:hypothetical protein BBJ28_00015979, partial [Nothophytophthora sp. Chile5]
MALILVVPKGLVFHVTLWTVQYIIYCKQPSRSTCWFLLLVCFLLVWSSICRLRFWLPADESVLHAVESQIYGRCLGSGFSLSTVAGLGTVHVPYNGNESGKSEPLKPPRTLVLVHGYGAGNAFWAAGAAARGTPLCDVLVPEKWAVPVTFLYGGGPDWMPKEPGEAVVQRLQTSKSHYASLRIVPLSGHQVFMDNPSAFNRAVAEAVWDWELHTQNGSVEQEGDEQAVVGVGLRGRATAGATAVAITWVLYLCIPHIPVDLLDWPLVITAGIAIDVLIPPLKLVHGLVFVALVVYAAIRVSLTDGLVSGSTEKGLVDTLAVVCCVFPLWLSVCSLHLWLPADGKVLDAVEKKIYEQYLVTEFSQTKVAGLGTIHVPYCGDNTQLPPRILVLVHGYMAGNAFWAAAMYSTYFAEKYPARIEHLILISPAGVNSSGLKPEDLPSFLKFTGMFYITPMVGISIARLLLLLFLVSSIEALTLLL